MPNKNKAACMTVSLIIAKEKIASYLVVITTQFGHGVVVSDTLIFHHITGFNQEFLASIYSFRTAERGSNKYT
jgi:hypothetical protein